MKGYKRIRVFPDRDLRATRLELAVLDCRVIQRLQDTRQLGKSLAAYPTAEHSRFSHSLGTLYWVSKMLSYLKENYFAEGKYDGYIGNKKLLETANTKLKQTVLRGYSDKFEGPDFLEITFFEQMIRLAALLHDITHLPFGHTLEDQARLLPRHDEDPERIKLIYGRLVEEVMTSPHLKDDTGKELQPLLIRLLDQCQALYYVGLILKRDRESFEKEKGKWGEIEKKLNVDFFPFLSLAYDMVNNTICADLIDYLQRDTLAAGMPWTLDKALFSQLKILRTPSPNLNYTQDDIYRFGVNVARDKLRHDVITAVLSLLRARYDLTEKVYYHHTKCAADAMLEKAIRLSGISLDSTEILNKNFGDEGFLNFLEDKFTKNENAFRIFQDYRSRRFHKAVFKLQRNSGWSKTTKEAVEKCETPEGRTEMENIIAKECGDLSVEYITISCLPKDMQLKEAKALVEWTDGEVLPLSELPKKKKYLLEVTHLTERYNDLWSLTIYLNSALENFVGVVISKCEQIFGCQNDHLLASYIKQRYPVAQKIKETIDSFTNNAEFASVQATNVAFGGGDPSKEVNIPEVVYDQLGLLLINEKNNSKQKRKDSKIKGEKKNLTMDFGPTEE